MQTNNLLGNRPPVSSSLTGRAELTRLIYGLLNKVGTEGNDGIKQALLDITSNGLEVVAPPSGTDPNLLEMYGLQRVIVAPESDPFQMIPRYEKPEFDDVSTSSTTILRQALRRIVDEV